MATTCPVGFDVEQLRAQVLATYDRVAREPEGDFHFHRGPYYASRYLRYNPAELIQLPEETTSRFAGVGNPLLIGPLYPGETVLDHACGAGTDLLLAAKRVGKTGRAIGIDMTPSMCAIAKDSAAKMGLRNVRIENAVYESLPVADNSVDVVISNGVLNLAPDKTRVFDEIFRVLKPGGRLYLADVVVARELSLTARTNPDLWAACVAGALPEFEMYGLAAATGFRETSVTERFDCFRDTPAMEKVSKDLRIQAINFYARKPID